MDYDFENCFSCGGHEFLTIPYIGNHGSSGVVNWDSYCVKACRQCGLGFISPDPPPELLDKFYSEDYEKDEHASNHNFFNKSISIPYMSQILNLAIFLDVYHQSEINYLDIGCGAFGYSFNSMKQIYPNKKVNCFGIDSSPLVIATLKLNQVKFLGEDYYCLERGEKKFEAITMSHCLEHFALQDALNFLKIIKQSLTENGRLMIEVPCDDFRIQKRQKLASSPHTIFFTEESLVNLLTKAGYIIYYRQTLGDDKEKIWESISKDAEKPKSLVYRLKVMIPVIWKEKIKLFLNGKSALKILPRLYTINKKGYFLRVVVGK